MLELVQDVLALVLGQVQTVLAHVLLLVEMVLVLLEVGVIAAVAKILIDDCYEKVVNILLSNIILASYSLCLICY